MSARTYLNRHRAIRDRFTQNRKDIRAQFSRRGDDNAALLKERKKRIKKIVRIAAREALKQPKITAATDMAQFLCIGRYNASTNIAAIDAAVLAFRVEFSSLWMYREYLHGVANADSWRSQYEQWQARVKSWEHSNEEAQRQYDHKQYMASVRHSASDNQNAVYNEPYKPNESPKPELHLSLEQLSFARGFDRSQYTPDEQGFLWYLYDNAPDFYKEITRTHPFYLKEADRIMHTYIVGGSGSGKSELLKSTIYNYVTNDHSAVVVLDPNGDFAGQIAQWQELATSDDLVYLEYNLKQNLTFTINPFSISGLAPEDRSPQAINTRVVVANQLQDAFIQIVSGGGGGDEFTINMKALLMPCITTLLEYPDATILDLQRFMNDDLNEDLIAFAKSLTHYPNNVTFFSSEFMDKSYSPTKKAVAKKIRSLLNFPPFYHLTCGKSTVDIEALVNARKTLIFSLSKGAIGETVVGAFGRLVVSMLQGMAMRRESIPRSQRVPCHLFIDECHNFISPSIEEVLVEARKYALHLTMAQQAVGYKMSTQLKYILGINTVVKISGKMPPTAWNDTAAYIGAPSQMFAELMEHKGRYICTAAGSPPVVVAGRTDLLDENNCVDADAWREAKAQQIERYYRNYLDEERAEPLPETAVECDDTDTQDRLDFEIR